MSRYIVVTNMLSQFDYQDEINQKSYDRLKQMGCPKHWFDKIEEPEVKEGQYWQFDRACPAVRIVSVDFPFVAYHGIDCSNDPDNLYKCNIRVLREGATLLSDDEAGEALIEEAKRRYSIGDDIVTVATNGKKANLHDPSTLRYNSDLDELWWGKAYLGEQSYRIYKQGDWPEIIEDEWEVEWTGFSSGNLNDSVSWGMVEIYVTDGTRKVKMKHMKEEEAIAIAIALNELD